MQLLDTPEIRFAHVRERHEIAVEERQTIVIILDVQR